MSLRFLIVIILVFTFSKANAGYIKGLGANQCGKVISTVEEGEKQNIEWVNMMYTAWIQGYLSGLDDDKPNNNSRLHILLGINSILYHDLHPNFCA